MAHSFTRLRQQLEAVQLWLAEYPSTNPTQKERDLAESLRQYIDHCYRDDKKWRSESKAEDAIFKNQFGLDHALQTDFEKGLNMQVDRSTSAYIVKEMIKVLGDSRAAEILDVSQARLKTLVDEHGYLTRPQLERISAKTGNSWPRWYVEATAFRAKTAKDRAFVDSAREMWDRIDGRTTPWPNGIAVPSMKPSVRGLKKAHLRTHNTSGLRHAI